MHVSHRHWLPSRKKINFLPTNFQGAMFKKSNFLRQRFFHAINFVISRLAESCLEFRVIVFKSRVTGVESRGIEHFVQMARVKSSLLLDRVYPTLVDSMKLLTTRL